MKKKRNRKTNRKAEIENGEQYYLVWNHTKFWHGVYVFPIIFLPWLFTSGFPFYGVIRCLLLKDFGFADWRPLPQVEG